MQPNYADSIAFLKRFHPGRRWVLTGIHPDKDFKPRTITATFDEKTEGDCSKWLHKQGETYNLYFVVNECKGFMLKKPERTDISKVWYLHVDIDPNTGEAIGDEQARIVDTLKGIRRPEIIPGKLPKPSIITFSGGGYQGFWPLAEPILIDGDLAKAEDAKLYNLDIEVKLGADHVHNIDRIMRLPGSINRPDEKKRAKGRVEALANVVIWDDEKYGLDRFSKANPVKAAATGSTLDIGGTGGSKDRKAINSNYQPPAEIKRIETLDALTIPDWVKALINVGYDSKCPKPGQELLPKQYESRSEALFAAICMMVKGKVPFDTIYSVITDSRFGIADSVLDKGNRIDSYARRQINRAIDESVHPWLAKMNERFAVIESWNGKCRVIEEQMDEGLDRTRIVAQTFDDFMNRYMNIMVNEGFNEDGKPIEKPLGLWWLKQHNRRQYQKIVFVPNQEVQDSYNLWRGYGCEAKTGDCSKFLEHLRKVVCKGNVDHYQYLIGWLANAVQNPNRPGQTAIVLKGDQGTGKGVFIKGFGSLFGRHFLQVSDSKHLVGNFNAHLRDCVVLFADEAFFAGDKRHANILKMLITEDMLAIEKKGIDVEPSANCIHLLMASNDHWVVPAGIGDRRFFVLHVSSEHKEDIDYFGEIDKEMESGGREALLHYLMHLDISKFDVRTMPKTEELQQQKLFTLPTEEMWWREKLAEGRLLPQNGSWVREIAEGDLFYDYLTFCRTSNCFRRQSKSSLRSIVMKYVKDFERYTAEATVEVMQPDGQKIMVERPLFYRFPTLEECRAQWDNHFGGKTELGNGKGVNEQYDMYKDESDEMFRWEVAVIGLDRSLKQWRLIAVSITLRSWIDS
jgi:hypothetical protein